MKNTFPGSISKIINELNSLVRVDSNVLSDIILQSNPSEIELKEYCYFNHSKSESYGRNIICDNGKFKILLMSWLPSDFTAIHNHGYTDWGCVHFFGDATHRLYELKNEKLEVATKDYFQAGQNAAVCGDLTHIMGNSGKKEFSTLHVYGSNTLISDICDDAVVYIPEKKKKVTTSGSAYLDMNESLKKTETEFNNISQEALLDYLELITPFYLRNKKENIVNNIRAIQNNPDIFYVY